MTIAHVVVAIPARDEEEHLRACLHAITCAASRVPVPCSVVVGLDGCTDDSARIARRAGAFTVDLGSRGVGATRDAAIRAGLGTGRPAALATDRVWIANTDADTLVPDDWFLRHLALADAGADVVVGTVEPAGPVDPRLLAAWHARHELAEDHSHVHGANLGVRASTYLGLGGFAAVRLHEDVDLVTRARAAGAVVVATDTTRVSTSGRLQGRAENGFAGYLREVAREVEEAAPALTSRLASRHDPSPARRTDARPPAAHDPVRDTTPAR